LIDLELSFEQVQQKLGAFRQVTFGQAETALECFRVTTTRAALVSEYAPLKLGKIHGVNLLEVRTDEYTQLKNAAYEVLESLFPCNPESLFQEIMEEGSNPGIIIDPVLNIDSENFGEMVDDPAQFGNGPMTSLMIFAKYLVIIIDAPYFENAAEHFRWSVDIPECCAATNSIDSVDENRFYALLDEHDLSDYRLPFQCLQQETGNDFLDWSLDEAYENPQPYTMESIRYLVNEWERARPQVKLLEAAAERFTKDRWIASKIVELWDQCVRYKDGRVPQTLLEMWGADNTTVDDEFYGPIGVEGSDD
jgi:hypothetical protein